MNKIGLILLFLIFLCANSSAQEKEFVIRGQIPGMRDSIVVSLLTAEELPTTTICETVVKDGCFELRGQVKGPMLCTLITTNIESLTEGEKIRWTYTPVFVDNVEMRVQTSHYDSIPLDAPITSDFKITGGRVQADFNEYNLWKLQGKGDKDFILAHPSSAISVYLGNKMLRIGYNLTRGEVEELEKTIVGAPDDLERFATFRRNCTLAKLTAKGYPIVNLALNDINGNACELSEVIPTGKYVLVDFWATWCGPCVAAIPEIKELAERFPEDLVVIGVSCDTDLNAWKVAIEKKQAKWAQYVFTKQGYKDFLEKYQVGGVPYFLILDKEGRVISNPKHVKEIKQEVECLCK